MKTRHRRILKTSQKNRNRRKLMNVFSENLIFIRLNIRRIMCVQMKRIEDISFFSLQRDCHAKYLGI